MTTNPPLTISLLSQLTNRELQSNYLNYLDRTPEIATLLAQITDKDLALRIVNLALEVDLFLGANLTASLSPDLQKIVIDEIDLLEIPTRLKIDLWSKTKSKVALPYLQDIFIFKHRQSEDWDGRRTIESAISAIVGIDRDLAITLLIEALYDARFYSKAVEFLTELAPVEAIEGLAGLLNSPDLRNYDIRSHTIQALIKIGTEEAIAKIRDALHIYKLQWSSTDWIQGLGIVAEPAMIEHLIDLLYEPALYTDCSGRTYAADRPCCEAVVALERIGGEKVFDWLHQAIYWISAADEFRSPFHTIVQTLFRLDSDRALTAIEGAIQSYDPIVRKRAAMALTVSEVPICDRNLSILLNAIDDPDLDVQIKIICGIKEIIHLSVYAYNRLNIAPELIDRAILATNPIILKYINHPDLEFRDRFIGRLSTYESRQWQIIEENKEPEDLHILLKLLEDPDMETRQWAVVSIVELGSAEIFPIVLKLANDPELVATLIFRLKQSHYLEPGGVIFNEFHRDRSVAIEFLETAEKSLIEAIEHNISHLCPNIFRLGEIGTDRAIPTLQKIIKSDAYAYYDEPEDATRSLAIIGTDAARMALIEILTDRPNLGRSVFDIFADAGSLGLLPQLWSAYRQTYIDDASVAISKIQSRAGLYNPDFSDRSHPLFEPPPTRLRHILLRDTSTESVDNLAML
jgi:HEAT repeat protein